MNPDIQYLYPRIVLAGMMGSGKSTIAKILSSKLNWKFIDTDDLIERKMGKKIRTIFEQEGEDYFRGLERELVQQYQSEKYCVIATGGGMIVSEENRNLKSQIEDLKKSQSGLETKVDKMTNLFQATFENLTKASIETIGDLEKKTRTKKK